MALNIKNHEAERLAAEVAELAGESKTTAVRTALEERKRRLLLAKGPGRGAVLCQLLAEKVWPDAPPGVLGKSLSKAEREAILGYGPAGV